MRQSEAIAQIFELCPDRRLVCANGLISRWASMSARDGQAFYMLGSMGLAPSIALGMALAKPDTPVGVIDGDGNLLMDASSLAAIGNAPVRDFVHFNLNNRSYSSTGGQPTVARFGLFERLSKAAGYDQSHLISSFEDLRNVCSRLGSGRVFCEITITEHDEFEPRRVALTCAEIARVVALTFEQNSERKG